MVWLTWQSVFSCFWSLNILSTLYQFRQHILTSNCFCYSQVLLDRMLAQLAQCEFAVTKSRLSASMSAAELQNYKNLSLLIETGIEAAKQDIESTKLDFQEAKTVRKNRIEYDVLAKVINEQPDRKETDEKLSQLRKELNLLEVSSQSSLVPVSWLTLPWSWFFL